MVEHSISGLHELSEESCQEAAAIRKNWFMMICYGLNVLFSLVALSSTAYLLRSKEFRRLGSVLSRNLRLIICAGVMIYLLGIILPGVFYSYMFSAFFMNPDDCDYVWKTKNCVMFRATIIYTIVGLGIFHILMSLERVFVTQNDTLDERLSIGVLFFVLAILLPAGVAHFMFGHELEYAGPFKLYCFPTAPSVSKIRLVTCSLAVADLLFVFVDYRLFKCNVYKLKNKPKNYSLQRSYKLREMQTSIRLIFPLCVIHSLFYLPFLVFYFLNWLFDGAEQVKWTELAYLSKSLYNMIIPLTINVLLRRRPNEVNEWKQASNQLTDEYFRQFNAQLK